LIKRLAQFLGLEAGWPRYFENTSWLLAGRVVQVIAALIAGILLTRYLGPDQFGIYSFALSFVALFAPIANMGLGQVVVRQIVSEPEAEREILWHAVLLRMSSSIFFLGSLFIAAWIFVPGLETQYAIGLCALAVLLRTPQLLIFYFQAKVASRWSAVVHLISVLISTALKIAGIVLGWPLMAFVALIAFDALLYSSGLLIQYRRWRKMQDRAEQAWAFGLDRYKQLFSETWPLMLGLLIFVARQEIDHLMIKGYLDFKAVGWYAAAQGVSIKLAMIPEVLAASLFPAILSAKARDEALFKERISNLYALYTFLAYGLIIGAWIFSRRFVILAFGEAYLPTAGVLSIQVSSLLFVFMGFAGEKWIISEKLQAWRSLSLFIGVAVHMLLNIWLIPQYGVLGAAWSNLIGSALAFHFNYALFPKTRSIFIEQSKALWNGFMFIPSRLLRN
jgi:O-antigen/teichoic acid export membrane protein